MINILIYAEARKQHLHCEFSLNYSPQRIFTKEPIFSTFNKNTKTLNIVKPSIIQEIYFAMYACQIKKYASQINQAIEQSEIMN